MATPALSHAGRIALVTGATGDIGRAIATELARKGAELALTGRDPAALAALAQMLGAQTGRRIETFATDLRDAAAPARLMAWLSSSFGRLDVLVTAAAQFRIGSLLDLEPDDWQEGFGAMFFGAAETIRQAWPLLRATRGHVVMISGVFAVAPAMNAALPSAIAGALLNLSKSTAAQGIEDGISVNCVLPGSTESARLDQTLARFAAARGLSLEEAPAAYARHAGIERVGRPDEIAKLVAFITSGEADYLRGASVVIDGGFSRSI